MNRRIGLFLWTALAAGAGLAATPPTTQNPPAKDAAMEKEAALRYGLSGKMMTKPGQRDVVVALLLRDVEKLKAAGCDVYVVSVSAAHPDAVFVSEVWVSREAHRASLKLPSVQQAISEARPLLTGQVESVELSVIGGLGVPKAPPK